MIQFSYSKTPHIKQPETWENLHISQYYAKYRFTVLKHHYTVLQGEMSHFTIIKRLKTKKITTNCLICDKQQQVQYIHKQYGFPGTHIYYVHNLGVVCILFYQNLNTLLLCFRKSNHFGNYQVSCVSY